MMRPWVFLLFLPLALTAQTAGTLNLYPANPQMEQAELNQAVAEAGSSAVDLMRVLEQHLRRYPDSARRSDIEASLYKSAADANDHARIVLYGQRLLVGKPDNELEILDRVIRALLASDDKESATKALGYVVRYKVGVADLRARQPEGHATAAQWADLADRALARAMVLEARAEGNLGDTEKAVASARSSWEALPTAEAAHEIARWLVRLGREEEAIGHYAEAVTIEDTATTWANRDRDRKTASELYVKAHGTSQGLAEVFEKAWDRSAAALRDRSARFKAMDSNYGVTDAFGFVLPPVGAGDAGKLEMAKFRGKTVVIDFWATWCAPCVAQHPLIENAKKKYTQSSDVVFLSLNADDDHSLVEPFLAQQKWAERVYLEAGLAGPLGLTSLPTVLVIDPAGQIHSRITGFNTDTFEPLLHARIAEARAVAAK